MTRDRYFAEDVAQEVMIRFLASRAFDERQGVWPYLWTSAKNLVRDARRGPDQVLMDVGAIEVLVGAEDHDFVDRIANRPLIRDAFDSLVEDHRTALHLKYELGLPTVECAARMDRAPEAFKQLLYRARTCLADTLMEGGLNVRRFSLAPLTGLLARFRARWLDSSAPDAVLFSASAVLDGMAAVVLAVVAVAIGAPAPATASLSAETAVVSDLQDSLSARTQSGADSTSAPSGGTVGDRWSPAASPAAPPPTAPAQVDLTVASGRQDDGSSAVAEDMRVTVLGIQLTHTFVSSETTCGGTGATVCAVVDLLSSGG